MSAGLPARKAWLRISVCGPIMNVMIITLSGMSAGVLVVISGLLGAGDIKRQQDAAHTSVALYALRAAVMTVLGLLFVPQILRLVQTPARRDAGGKAVSVYGVCGNRVHLWI